MMDILGSKVSLTLEVKLVTDLSSGFKTSLGNAARLYLQNKTKE